MLLEEFRALVLAHLVAKGPDKAGVIAALKNDDDLLTSGLVDSYALIDLVLALEAQTGAIIDIGTLEPAQFGSIEALFKVVTAGEGGAANLKLAS